MRKQNLTPFFRCFAPLLFGKPPVSSLKKAMEELPRCHSLPQLRKFFGCYIPEALLAPKASGSNSRQRVFSLDVLFWAFLDQVQTPAGSCREAVRKVMALVRRSNPHTPRGVASPETAAYCKARARLALDVIDNINRHLVERLQKNTPREWLWHGRCVKLVDATSVSMPDTPQNQALWPQPSGQKPGCGFPVMSVAGLFCMGSGALIDAAWGSRRVHETMLFRQILHRLEAGDLLLSDRAYCSFAMFAELLERKVDSLMRLPEKRIRQSIGAKLPKADTFDVIIEWQRPAQRPAWMSKQDYERMPKSIPVRVVRYQVAAPGFRTRSVTLVTTLLDPQITAAELAALYMRRWSVELHFRQIKTTLGMDVLRCMSPAMIEREVRMHFVAYNLLRCVMQKAALTHHADIARLSFKGSLDCVRQFSNALAGAHNKPKTIEAMIEEMLLAIARDTVAERPKRSEPRVKKRRAKNYRLLTKPRHKMHRLPHRKDGIENHLILHPKPALS